MGVFGLGGARPRPPVPAAPVPAPPGPTEQELAMERWLKGLPDKAPPPAPAAAAPAADPFSAALERRILDETSRPQVMYAPQTSGNVLYGQKPWDFSDGQLESSMNEQGNRRLGVLMSGQNQLAGVKAQLGANAIEQQKVDYGRSDEGKRARYDEAAVAQGNQAAMSPQGQALLGLPGPPPMAQLAKLYPRVFDPADPPSGFDDAMERHENRYGTPIPEGSPEYKLYADAYPGEFAARKAGEIPRSRRPAFGLFGEGFGFETPDQAATKRHGRIFVKGNPAGPVGFYKGQ